MRIKFVNAYNGNEEFGGKFFEKLGKLALCDIRVAQATGDVKNIVEALKKTSFKGTIVDSKQYEETLCNGLKEKVSYITFTMQVKHLQDRYSETTGEFIETTEVEETYTYYLEVRSNF
jgi:hypothetical protein